MLNKILLTLIFLIISCLIVGTLIIGVNWSVDKLCTNANDYENCLRDTR